MPYTVRALAIVVGPIPPSSPASRTFFNVILAYMHRLAETSHDVAMAFTCLSPVNVSSDHYISNALLSRVPNKLVAPLRFFPSASCKFVFSSLGAYVFVME